MVLLLFLLYRPGRESDSEAEDFEHAEKLRQVKAVLEEVLLFVLNISFMQDILSLFVFIMIKFIFCISMGSYLVPFHLPMAIPSLCFNKWV